jgi:hypothetical protein
LCKKNFQGQLYRPFGRCDVKVCTYLKISLPRFQHLRFRKVIFQSFVPFFAKTLVPNFSSEFEVGWLVLLTSQIHFLKSFSSSHYWNLWRFFSPLFKAKMFSTKSQLFVPMVSKLGFTCLPLEINEMSTACCKKCWVF